MSAGFVEVFGPDPWSVPWDIRAGRISALLLRMVTPPGSKAGH